MLCPVRFKVQFVSGSDGVQPAGAPDAAGDSVGTFELVAVSSLSRKTTAPATRASRMITSTTAATGNFFAAGRDRVSPATMPDFGRWSTSDAAKTSLELPSLGAWGTTILRKQVGHSICEPPTVESHVMCWPQTGQANLNSLMARYVQVVCLKNPAIRRPKLQ